MKPTDIIKATVWEDGGATNMARLKADGANVTQSVISSISYSVFDLDGSSPGTAVDSGSLTVANVIFDTLQTDGRWTADDTGYNFRHTIGASTLAEGNRRYLVEYIFTPSSAEVFPAVFELHTKPLRTS